MTQTCRRCHGQGRVIVTPCRQCAGKGTVTRTQSVNVQIPAGVADGQTLRVPVAHSEVYVVLKVSTIPSHVYVKEGSIIIHSTLASFPVPIPNFSMLHICAYIEKIGETGSRLFKPARTVKKINSSLEWDEAGKIEKCQQSLVYLIEM